MLGGMNMTGPLRRVLVRPPGADLSRWREYGWRGEPDSARIAEEHEGLRAALAEAGAEVVVATSATDGNLDASTSTTPRSTAGKGAILLRPGRSRGAARSR